MRSHSSPVHHAFFCDPPSSSLLNVMPPISRRETASCYVLSAWTVAPYMRHVSVGAGVSTKQKALPPVKRRGAQQKHCREWSVLNGHRGYGSNPVGPSFQRSSVYGITCDDSYADLHEVSEPVNAGHYCSLLNYFLLRDLCTRQSG